MKIKTNYKSVTTLNGYMAIIERTKNSINGSPRYNVELFLLSSLAYLGTYRVSTYSGVSDEIVKKAVDEFQKDK